MRRWRSHHPHDPRTAWGFDAMAGRIFRRRTKNSRVKNATRTPKNGDGIDRTTKRWKRYQKTPVIWKGPRSLQDHPRSGAWGGRSAAGAVTGALRDSVTSGSYSDTP